MGCGDHYRQSPEAERRIAGLVRNGKAAQAAAKATGFDPNAKRPRMPADQLIDPLPGPWASIGIWIRKKVLIRQWWRLPWHLADWLADVIFDRGPAMLGVLLSGKVAEGEYAARNDTCGQCEHRYRVAEVRGGLREESYCVQCRCGIWRWRWPGTAKVIVGANLSFKNRFRGWKCPLGKHAGSKPWQRLQQAYERRKRLDEEKRKAAYEAERRKRLMTLSKVGDHPAGGVDEHRNDQHEQPTEHDQPTENDLGVIR